MDKASLLEWAIGALFVGVNAYRRYNTPASNRASTTFQNYTIYFIFYLLSILTLYVFVGAVLDSSPETIGWVYGLFMGQLNTKVPDQIASLSSPMVSALFLTTLLPSLPWLSRYDQTLLNTFWDRGHIPNHVYKMAASMRRAPFNFSPWQMKQLRKRCEDLGIAIDRLQLQQGDELEFCWARVNVLMDSVTEWKQDDSGRVRRFMNDQRDEMARLEQLRDEVNHEFTDLKTSTLEKHVEQKIERFLERSIAELFRSITVLIAKTVCITAYSEDGRNSRIVQIGFEGGGRRFDRLSSSQIASAMFAIFITFLALSVAQELNKEVQFRSFSSVGFMTFLMLFTYGAALNIALYLKQRVGMGYNELTNKRPWFAYLLVAVLTALSWFVVTGSYRYIYNMLSGISSDANIAKVLTDIGWSHPYLLQSVALAMALSWILDFHHGRDQSTELQLSQRLFYTGISLLALILASAVAFYWMEGWGWFAGVGTRDEAYRCTEFSRCSERFIWFVVKGMAVGAVVGWLVPMWYHLNRTKAPDQIAGRLIAMNQKELSNEIRSLAPGELVKVVAGVSAAVASIDNDVSRSEEDVYQIICSHLAGLRNSDVDLEVAEQEFKSCLEQIDNGDFQLQERLALIKRSPLLSKLMPYVASSIAFADSVYLEKERQVVEEVREFVGA